MVNSASKIYGSWRVKANWFRVIHDILPTNWRLHTIRLTDSALCSTCGQRDTLMHSAEGLEIWEWTRKRIFWILRMDPVWIPYEWTLRPHFHIWPPRRHRAVLWIIAHTVWYRVQESRTPSAHEYLDFLRRARWKAYQDTGRVKNVGNYLAILETLKSYVNYGRP
jgi:hypothetical protein